jgi:hypothetical protein
VPYLGPRVNEQRRRRITPDPAPAVNTAELNYQITTLVDKYLALNGVSYRTINDVTGALECAKGEFKRRIADPYEERKLRENGDVFSPEVIAQADGRE